MRKHNRLATTLLCFASLAGCGQDAPPATVASPTGYALADRPPGLPDSATSYRVTHLYAPDSSADWGYDFGGKIPRNQLGNILGFVQECYTPAQSIQARYDQAVGDGAIGLTLLVERYPAGTAADTAITLDTRAADDGFTTLWGVRDGSDVEATGGDMSLSLSVLSGVRLHAQAIRVAATVGSDGVLHGRINGIIPASELARVYPIVAAAMNAYVARSSDSDAATTLALFDDNHDGTISAAEVAQSQLVTALSAPDVTVDVVDLGPVSGISFGMGFDAVSE